MLYTRVLWGTSFLWLWYIFSVVILQNIYEYFGDNDSDLNYVSTSVQVAIQYLIAISELQ